MFCEICGMKNKDTNYYCTQCGTYIGDKEDASKASFQENHQLYCEYCGSKTEERYCSNCGRGAYSLRYLPKQKVDKKIEEDNGKEIRFKEIQSLQGISPKIQKYINEHTNSGSIIYYVITSIEMLVIGMILSLFIFICIQNFDCVQWANSVMLDLGEEVSWEFGDGDKTFDLQSHFIDMYGVMYQVPYQIKLNVREERERMMGGVVISLKFLILLILPVLIVYFVHKASFKDGESTLDHIFEYALKSLCFAFIVQIVFMFAARSIKETGVVASFKLSMGFNSFLGFFHIFITTFMTMVIFSIYKKKEYRQTVKTLNGSLFEILPVFLKNISIFVFLFIFIVLGQIVFLDIDFEDKLKVIIAVLLFIPNIFLTMWLLLFGGELKLVLDEFILEILGYGVPIIGGIVSLMKGEAGAKGLSLWGVFSGVGRIKEELDLEFTKILPLYLFIMLISLGVIVIILSSLSKFNKKDYRRNIAFFAGIVAVFNGILSYCLNILVKVKGDAELLEQVGLDPIDMRFELGFSTLKIIIKTFIFIIFIGYIHHYGRKQEWYSKLQKLWQQNFKIIKWAYGIVVVVMFMVMKMTLKDVF